MTATKKPRVTVIDGQLRDLRVWFDRVERNLIVLGVDSNTKYPRLMLSRAVVVAVWAYADEHTLRPSRRKRYTEIRVELPPGNWSVEVPDGARYSFQIVIWREPARLRPRDADVIWPKPKGKRK